MAPGITVFSGGSATNSLVDVLESLRASTSSTLHYVIPISDNGGSSSEIIRVFGGPGIGDIRSRLVRLIPDSPGSLKPLLNHRLPASASPARLEWHDLIDGSHPLWRPIPSPKRELVRSFLNAFNLEVVKRSRPSSRFDFSNASVGNLFLTGARLFTGSFEASIYLLSSLCGVPDQVSVLPALDTNFAHHIAAGLADGSIITGQNDISHPSEGSCMADDVAHVEDANLPGSLPALRRPAIRFSKTGGEDLPSRITRVWYINPYGQEIQLPANPRVLAALHSSHTVVYSIGSLYTSIVPSLILRGVARALRPGAHKILLLNGSIDRETGPSTAPFTALDFVAAIAHACALSAGDETPFPKDYSRYVSHVVYLEADGAPLLDKPLFASLGIDTTRLYGTKGTYDPKALAQCLESIIGRLPSERARRYTFVA